MPANILPLPRCAHNMQCHCIEPQRLTNTELFPISSFIPLVLPYFVFVCVSSVSLLRILPLLYLSILPYCQREAIGCYHTDRVGMAGYARLNWEIYLSHSGRPSVALTRFHLLPLQAFESLLQLYEARATYEEFCIPMCMLPATISNNVPGTDLSIGADTALNAIVEVRQSKHCWHNCKHFEQNAISLNNGAYGPVLIPNKLSGSRSRCAGNCCICHSCSSVWFL